MLLLLLLLSKLLLLLCCRCCCYCLHCCCCCVAGAVTVDWSSWFSLALSFRRTDAANRIPLYGVNDSPPTSPLLPPSPPPACPPKQKQTQRNGRAPLRCFLVDALCERHGHADEGDEWDRETIGSFARGWLLTDVLGVLPILDGW